MPYLTREDGTHFVIPSYRDVISVKNAAAAKKEIMQLSSSYGQYIAIRETGPVQYEVAYSNDTGYLFGESVWHYFKQPLEMIYCEAIPNTTEVILVIVKDWSVYLDGRFPADGVQEELVSFLTQSNHFAIYVYGNVPISQTYEKDKFSFEPSAVRSFTVLDAPIFNTLPLYPAFQLQTVDRAIKARGIGMLPVKNFIGVGVAAVVILILWIYLKSVGVSVPKSIAAQINPYQTFSIALSSPAPEKVLRVFSDRLVTVFSMPGWLPGHINYATGSLTMSVQSQGSNIQTLLDWANRNNAVLTLNANGIDIALPVTIENRQAPVKIYSLQQIVIEFSDNLALIYPGNHLSIAPIVSAGVYSTIALTLSIESLSPATIALIGKACQGLPLVLNNMDLAVDSDGLLTGKISFEALGTQL
ncbi:MAG: hypothetical protein ACD_45C00648G0002 [uncultured bacterium]|nr:MAG: hypothetical protein ACD_45C00648G0002 [uncultured bacterium]OGT55317.1 MAG: hypothetical protein A3F43_03630 [Gammaproteobacteria bacterium RIFCSPHIGHO2_12_FULL_42_10]